MEPPRIYGGNATFKRCLKIFTNEDMLFNVRGLISNASCNKINSTFAKIKFSSGAESCCELDDLSCLGMFDR